MVVLQSLACSRDSCGMQVITLDDIEIRGLEDDIVVLYFVVLGVSVRKWEVQGEWG